MLVLYVKLFSQSTSLHESLNGPFYKQLIVAPAAQNKQFIHHGYLYSAIIICLCSHFAVMTVFEVFLNQGSHKILAFDPWIGLLMCPFFIADTKSDYLLCFQ